MFPASSDGNTSTLALPATGLDGDFRAATAGASAASPCNSPSTARSGATSSTRLERAEPHWRLLNEFLDQETGRGRRGGCRRSANCGESSGAEAEGPRRARERRKEISDRLQPDRLHRQLRPWRARLVVKEDSGEGGRAASSQSQ